MLLTESRDGARQDKRGDRRDRADAQEAALGRIAHCPFGLADRGENGLRAAEELVPGIREDDLAAQSVEKTLADPVRFAFQSKDLFAEGWLSDTLTLGGARETAGFRHGNEITKLVQFHNQDQ